VVSSGSEEPRTWPSRSCATAACRCGEPCHRTGESPFSSASGARPRWSCRR
jgi:hypothetical protein